MSDLARLSAWVAEKLWDSEGDVWTNAIIEEAIRSALAEYNQALPLAAVETLTLAADGPEIDISSLDGLQQVIEAWWPCDAQGQETPPNRVRGFWLARIGGEPVLHLDVTGTALPVAGDKARLWYTLPQTIADLDGATLTTLPPQHEAMLVLGAAGFAVQGRGLDLLRISEIDAELVAKYERWAESRLKEYRARLASLRGEAARSGRAWAAGWALDKWA